MLASLVNNNEKVADKKLKTFVANDENVVNSYGFRVRNAGLDYRRFDQNPIMLDSHINKTDSVRGNWQNRRVEGSKVLMDANFDTEDPASNVLAGKVERGFVKGASFGLGISFNEECFERQPDGNWDLIKAEVMELSVCGVPSLSSALALYDKNTGELIAEDQVKLSVQKLSAEFKKPNNPTMEKIILSTAAIAVLVGLNVTSTDNVTEISNSIVKLHNEKTTAEGKVLQLQTKLTEQAKSMAEALIDGAIADEKLTAGDRDEWVELAIANLSLASKQVAKLKGKESLKSKVDNTDLSAGDAVKTIDDFEKLSDEKKLAYQKANPDAYNALFA
jgi:hypothetical protein